jgi:hypothetical protein
MIQSSSTITFLPFESSWPSRRPRIYFPGCIPEKTQKSDHPGDYYIFDVLKRHYFPSSFFPLCEHELRDSLVFLAGQDFKLFNDISNAFFELYDNESPLSIFLSCLPLINYKEFGLLTAHLSGFNEVLSLTVHQRLNTMAMVFKKWAASPVTKTPLQQPCARRPTTNQLSMKLINGNPFIIESDPVKLSEWMMLIVRIATANDSNASLSGGGKLNSEKRRWEARQRKAAAETRHRQAATRSSATESGGGKFSSDKRRREAQQREAAVGSSAMQSSGGKLCCEKQWR